MRYPTPDDVELTAAIGRYVNPETGGTQRYGWLLHGNFTTIDTAARAPFLRQLARSARQVSDDELAVLLDSEWRSLGTTEQTPDRLHEWIDQLCAVADEAMRMN